MREIKRIGTERIDEYMEIYLNSYPAFKSLDDECRNYYREKTIRDMERGVDVDFFGCFEDGVLAATMKIVDFDINLFDDLLSFLYIDQKLDTALTGFVCGKEAVFVSALLIQIKIALIVSFDIV